MSPSFGISFILLISVVFIAYIMFLIQQNRLQDEIARHRRQEESERWQKGESSVLKSALKDYQDQPNPARLASPAR